MKNSEYYKSEAHQISVNNASKIACNTKYCCVTCKNIYPISNLKNHFCKPCPVCKTIFTGTTKKFCSKSCAATFNNKIRTPLMRQKQSNTLKEKFKNNPDLLLKFHSHPHPPKNFSRITFINCNQCKKSFIVKSWKANPNKFCSSDCRTLSHISGKKHYHGHKKIYKYLNHYTNEIVSLESSWEFKIAQYLDSLNINWTRPESISWLDENLKNHLYFADFYLPDYNIYLDPKNPYVMQQDKYKMSMIEKKVKIFYGSIKHLQNNIKNILNNTIGQGAGS